MKSNQKVRESRRFRITNWNYSWGATYFITLVTAFRDQRILGELVEQEVKLSVFGEIVEEEWKKSFNLRKEFKSHAFVIMPDHLHALVSITQPDFHDNELEVFTKVTAENTAKNFGVAYRPPNSIPSFVAGFKSAVTTRINRVRKTPGLKVWAADFHVRIIGSREEFENTVRYIENNPKKKK